MICKADLYIIMINKDTYVLSNYTNTQHNRDYKKREKEINQILPVVNPIDEDPPPILQDASFIDAF